MPTDHFRKDTALLVALFVEAICYGLYLDTFFHCLYILFRTSSGWKRRSEIQLAHLAVTLSLFLFGSVNLALGLVRAIQAFIYKEGIEPGGVFGQRWVSIVKVPLTLNIQTMVADGALIGRCWQVYGRNWVVIAFPLFLWLGGFGVTIWETLFETDIQKNPSYSGMLNIAYTIFWAISFVQKAYTTGMIILRIRRVENAVRPLRPKSEISSPNSTPSSALVMKQTSLNDVLKIIIDSGLIYTTTSFVAFCSQIALSNSVYITTSADVIIIGIAFNLIHIRVAKTRWREEALLRKEASNITTIRFQGPEPTTTTSLFNPTLSARFTEVHDHEKGFSVHSSDHD